MYSKFYQQEGANDCKVLTGYLSKLRNCIQTDKPMYMVTDGGEDEDIWNRVLKEETESRQGVPPSAFTTSWLYLECFMYRCIMEGIHKRYSSVWLVSFIFEALSSVALWSKFIEFCRQCSCFKMWCDECLLKDMGNIYPSSKCNCGVWCLVDW